MSIIGLIIYTIVAIVFSAFLMIIGRRLLAIKSLSQLIKDYRKNPKKFDWFEHYFLGFKFWNAKPLEMMIGVTGDKLATVWWKISGVMFIIFAVFFLVGTAILWVANFTA